MYINKKKLYFLTEIIVSAIIINPILYNEHAGIQRYFSYIAMLSYITFNLNYLSEMVNSRIILFRNKLIVILLLFVWSMFIPVVNGTFDFSFLRNFWYGIASLFFVLAIAVHVIKHCDNNEILNYFCMLYVGGMALYVIGTIMIITVPGLRNFVLTYLVTDDRDKMLLQYSQYYTRIGWSGMAAYGTSLKCTIAFAMSIYILNQNNKENKKKLVVAMSILLFIGNLFYARTGAMACILLFLIYCFNLAKYKSKIKKFIMLLLFVIVAFLIVRLVMIKYADNSSVAWIFESIYNFQKNNTFSVASTDFMKDTMLFLPETQTLLFGDGYYTLNGSYYMKTDLGVMRLTLYGGVFFSLALYAFVISTIRQILVSQIYRDNFLVNILFIIFVVFEVKGESTITLIPLFLVMCMLSCLQYANEMKINRKIGCS